MKDFFKYFMKTFFGIKIKGLAQFFFLVVPARFFFPNIQRLIPLFLIAPLFS